MVLHYFDVVVASQNTCEEYTLGEGSQHAVEEGRPRFQLKEEREREGSNLTLSTDLRGHMIYSILKFGVSP